MQIDLEKFLPEIFAAFLGVIAYLVRHYFSTFRKEIRGVQKDVTKIEGHLTALQADIRSNTIELTRATSELKAVWRFIDNAPIRATDKNGEHP